MTTPHDQNPQTANFNPQPAMNRAQSNVSQSDAARKIERLLDVELNVVVRFGSTQMSLRDVAQLGAGAMIELDRAADAPVEVLVNNRLFAHGETVVVDGYYGVRITEIVASAEGALKFL
jgi:flagellar motor switch protein FliN/FliY